MTQSLFLSGISGALDRLRGRSHAKLAAVDSEDGAATDRKPRPMASSIPWRPLTGPLSKAGRRARHLAARDENDELFVEQSVLVDILRQVPSVPGEQRFGFLLGRRLRCPVTDESYVLVDAIWTSEEPLSERHGTHRFEAAHQQATEEAGQGGRVVVGWFHNHSTLMGVQLSDHDLRLQSRFFPEPWQCALLVVPHSRQPDGGFLQRGRADSTPGLHIVPFYEVVPSDPTKPWSALETVVNWKNYWTPRQDVRRRVATQGPAKRSDPIPAESAPVETTEPSVQPTLWEVPLPAPVEASPKSAGPPHPRSPGGIVGDALIYAGTPVVIPPADSWEQRLGSLKLTLRRRAPWLAAALAAVLVGFLLLERLDRPKFPEVPAVFHPAVGPPESATATPAEFEALEDRLVKDLAAYRERRQDFDRGRIDCAGLSAGLVKVQQQFQAFSDYAARHGGELPSETRVAQRRLGSEIADAKRHFETAGCGT